MIKSAVYAGTFDPIHNGHINIIERALGVFGIVWVGIGINPKKEHLFTTGERYAMIAASLDRCKISRERVRIESFSTLLVDFADSLHVNAILRGIRPGDLEYEYQMAGINKELSKIERFYLMAEPKYSHINSTFIKATYAAGGILPNLVPTCVHDALWKLYKENLR
jgi:pantetheine-phosphate adenylyltransferase